MYQLPPGWAVHPNDPTYVYEIANPRNVQPITAFAGHQYQAPLPQQPPAPPYGGAPAYGGAGLGAASAPQGVPSYGRMDVDSFLTENEQDQREARGWGAGDQRCIWIDFDKVERPGDVSELTVRLLPDFFPDPKAEPCIVNARHRIFVEYVPGDHGNRKVKQYNCFEQPGGPKDCPLDKAIEIVKASGIQGAGAHVDNFKVEVTNVWQAINLDDPAKHWVQVVDQAGAAVIDPATGQPVWKQVPGFIRMKKTLQDSLRDQIRVKGDPTDLQYGYPIRLIRKKTGKEQMNVEYSAVALDKCPLDPQLYGIARNALDLRKEFGSFAERETLQQIAENILKKWGLGWHGRGQVGYSAPSPHAPPGSGAWAPHAGGPPGTTFNPNTGAVRVPGGPPQGYGPPAGPPQGYAMPQLPPPPPSSPAAPAGYGPPGAPSPGGGWPPGPVHTLSAPQGLPPGYGPPQGYAPPPPAAPGLGSIGLPSGPPQGYAPPPPPGMPPGSHPAPMPPGPGAPSPPGGGMSPEQLEMQLAGKAPF
jgi:hypothetical protein